jgi:Flp pilus assembly protein TadD
MAKQASIQHAVVVSSRPALINAVRAELKRLGIENERVYCPTSAEETVSMVEKLKSVFLILDWNEGARRIVQIVSTIKRQNLYEAVPTFLISTESAREIAQLATEYGVRRVHIGEVSQSSIRSHLELIFKEQEHISPVRQVLLQAAKLRKVGSFTDAVQILTKTYQLDPTNVAVGTELAESLVAAEDHDQAAEVAAACLELAKDDIRLINVVGRCELKRNNFAAATKYFERAQILNPFNPDRLVDLGTSFLRTGRLDDAVLCFGKATDLDQKNHAAKVGSGTATMMKGEINEALSILTRISDARELASIFNTAAILTIRAGNFDKGIQLYTSAIAAIGEDEKVAAKLYFNKGLGFLRVQRTAEAKEAFLIAIKLDPSYEKARRALQTSKPNPSLGLLVKQKTDGTQQLKVKQSDFEVGAHSEDDFGNDFFQNDGLGSDDEFSLDFDEESFFGGKKTG